MIYNRPNPQNNDRTPKDEGKLNAEQVIRDWLARRQATPVMAQVDDRPAWEKEAALTPVQDAPADDQPTPPNNTAPDQIQPSPSDEPLGIGYFVARVYTGRMAVPISDAVVTLTSRERNGYTLVATFRTDQNGQTPKIELSAPNRNLSEQPEPEGVIPFGIYNVVVTHPDYNTFSVEDVQVFDGQTTLQDVSLIPIAEGKDNETQDFVVPPQNL